MSERGFTLIEIIIAVSIIALLILLPFLAFGQIQKQGRDAQRKGDVASIRNALEQYYADNGTYPDLLEDLVTEGYLAEIPEDPFSGREVPGTNGTRTFDYEYIPETGNQAYTVLAPLEEGGDAGESNKYIVVNPRGVIEINGTPSPTPDGGGAVVPTYVQPPPPTNTPPTTPLPTYNPQALYFTDWQMDTDAPNKSKIFYANSDFSQIHQFSPEGLFGETLSRENQCISNEPTPRIVFSSEEDGDFDIYIADFNGANRVKLTNNTATDSKPIIAPDGSRIIYHSNKDGTSDLYSIAPDGTDEIRLTNSAEQEYFVNFVSLVAQSTSDTRIDIIYTDRTSGEEQIYKQRAYGSLAGVGNRVDISPIDNESSYGVSVSEDGRLITYHSRLDSVSPMSEIFVMTADGLDHRRMTDDYDDDFLFPVVSNDNNAVYFHQAQPESEFYKVPLSGGDRIQVNDNPTDNSILEHPPFNFWLDQYLVYRREYDLLLGLNVNTGTVTEFIGTEEESLVINTCVPNDDVKQQSTLEVQEISIGFENYCAKNTTGALYCWGRNSHGQLGTAKFKTMSFEPIEKVVALPSQSIDVFDVSGLHVCVQMADGTPYCWGNSGSGQVGDGTTSDRLWPIRVAGGPATGIQDISTGNLHSCAVTTSGAAYCWGNDDNNQLGNGSTNGTSATPVQVVGLTSGVSRIYASFFHSCAVMASGAAKCWGDNYQGMLGDGTTSNRSEPVNVSGLSDVTDISAGYSHTCALRSTGNVVCWGYNGDGQLGNGGTSSSYTPVAVQGLPAGAVQKIVSGWSHNCALTSGGAMYCWGENNEGNIGDGTTTDALTAKVVPGFSNGVIDIDVIEHRSCAVKSDNTLHCWGEDFTGIEQIDLSYEE
ncbi:MAG: prepilin-type N-terminal cleavage/methylation domain-containing protein [Patescibacteria group bacterium]